ncbi:MAG: hypothetical protein JWO06_1648 [Bacteroidota bacterium]|nr:hypothetical protein [Bacteroidota bacterium]
MKGKLFNRLLLFSLFGIALGFFGMLYEGLVTIPKMLDTSMERMLFWRDYYAAINPVIYYIPLTPLATFILLGLYFAGAKENAALRKQLGWAAILQITSLVITFCIVKQINPKLYYNNIALYAAVIPVKAMQVNILSVLRLGLGATGLALVFKAYMSTQKNSPDEKG